MSEPDRLSISIRRGALISYSGFFAGKLIALATTVIVARLLAPEHFGLIAIGLLVLSINEALAESGIGAAVVWRRGAPDLTAAVAFTLSVIGGTAMAVIVFLAAPLIAEFFDEPAAIPVVQVLAVCLLLSSPAAVFSGILQRDMRFGRRIIPDIGRALTKGIIGIPMAIAGFGVWSLVYGQVASVVVGLGLAIWLGGWRPRLSLDRSEVRAILPYALQIAAIGLLGIAIKKLDVVIIGYRFETGMLGQYTLAFSLIEVVVLGMCWSASQALFPALSQNVHDTDRLRQVFVGGLTILLAITVPIAVGMSVLAEPFILTVFGEKWAPAIPLMQILAFYSLIYSIGFNLGDLYKATGRPQILSWIGVVNLVLAVPILLIGSQWGVVGIAAGQVMVALVISVVNWIVAARLVGVGFAELVAALRGPAVAGAGAGVVCLVAGWTLLDGAPTVTRFLALSCIGAVTYAGLLAFAMRGVWPSGPGQRIAGRATTARSGTQIE